MYDHSPMSDFEVSSHENKRPRAKPTRHSKLRATHFLILSAEFRLRFGNDTVRFGQRVRLLRGERVRLALLLLQQFALIFRTLAGNRLRIRTHTTKSDRQSSTVGVSARGETHTNTHTQRAHQVPRCVRSRTAHLSNATFTIRAHLRTLHRVQCRLGAETAHTLRRELRRRRAAHILLILRVHCA